MGGGLGAGRDTVWGGQGNMVFWRGGRTAEMRYTCQSPDDRNPGP